MRKLWKFSEIGLDIVGVEVAAVEKAVAAERQAALRRARADRFVEPACEFRTRAGQGRTGAGQRGAVDVGTEDVAGGGGFGVVEGHIVPADHLRVEPCGLTAPRKIRTEESRVGKEWVLSVD